MLTKITSKSKICKYSLCVFYVAKTKIVFSAFYFLKLKQLNRIQPSVILLLKQCKHIMAV